PCMRNGQRIGPATELGEIRSYAATQLLALPETLRGLESPSEAYRVEISLRLRALAAEVDSATR
ncbi:MAG TPA: nicotinate phosphoribosyltransferase, partial [Burkholderiaceae bacterium]|nr:nicotinate phosphoribosyltransferase [Burkholderiaceae bacterium]